MGDFANVVFVFWFTYGFVTCATNQVLEAGHEGIPATLRDCSLKKEANELHNKYLKKCQAKVCRGKWPLDLQ